MTGKLAHRNTLPITAQELEKLLRAWGWTIGVSGTKHARWSQAGTTITVRRGGKENPTWEPVRMAAKVAGVNPDQWLQGPPSVQRQRRKELRQEDIDFFVQANHAKVGPVGMDRWNNIYTRMQEEGTLAGWKEARERYQVEKAEPIEPLPVVSDQQGYISLDDALALRGLKQNELSASSCQIITSLATHGDFEDKMGAATRRLMETLPCAQATAAKPILITGVADQVKQWETAGLIWREVRGKRTYKVGLSIPVKITPEEAAKHLLEQDGPEVTTEAEDVPSGPECIRCGLKESSHPIESCRKFIPPTHEHSYIGRPRRCGECGEPQPTCEHDNYIGEQCDLCNPPVVDKNTKDLGLMVSIEVLRAEKIRLAEEMKAMMDEVYKKTEAIDLAIEILEANP